MTALRTPATSSYRADIDGLRAVSILAVVGFHAGVPWLAGGYVGVDVFFVISGYLITGLLYAELEREGRIGFAAFYARRVRRLLPAAVLVVLATVIAGALLLSPALGEVQDLAKSALATLLICANLWYLRHSLDYFAIPHDQHPLLHTWSLSVEEQFYLVWPALMLVGWKIGAARGRPVRALCLTLVLIIFGSATPRRILESGAIVTGIALLFSGSLGWLARNAPVPAYDIAAKTAASDYPELTERCHASLWTEEHGDAHCLAETGVPRIVIWGDSHANHWAPALHRWATRLERSTAIEQWTLDACPPLFDATPTAVSTSHRIAFDACHAFNDRVRTRLASVAPEDRLGVIMASNWWYRTGDVRWKPTEPAHSFELTAVGEPESLRALEDYLRRSLQEITTAGYRVLVFLQSPVLEYPAPNCVLRRGPASCAVTVTAHDERAKKVNSIIHKVVGEFPAARVLDPAPLLCDDVVCPAVIDNVVAYSDKDHLTASIVHALAPRLEAEFQRLAE